MSGGGRRTLVVVASVLVLDLSVLDKENRWYVPRAEFGLASPTDIKVGESIVALFVSEGLLELSRVAPASPGGAQVDHKLAAFIEQRLQLLGGGRLVNGHLASMSLFPRGVRVGAGAGMGAGGPSRERGRTEG